MTSFNLVTSFKTVFKYSHILRFWLGAGWGLVRTTTQEFGGHDSAHHSRTVQS